MMAQTQQQMMQNPEVMQQLMNSPMVQQMLPGLPGRTLMCDAVMHTYLISFDLEE
jgi:hypothetical protein